MPKAIDTINDPSQFKLILPWLQMRDKQVFPRGIYPADVDGEVEIRRHHLWMEWKTIGQQIKAGPMQVIESRLDYLRRYGCHFTVWHQPATEYVSLDMVSGMQIIRWDESKDGICRTPEMETDGEVLLKWCHHWARNAESMTSRFITNFRKASGIYSGDPTW
jgi:hypothetical protein